MQTYYPFVALASFLAAAGFIASDRVTILSSMLISSLLFPIIETARGKMTIGNGMFMLVSGAALGVFVGYLMGRVSGTKETPEMIEISNWRNHTFLNFSIPIVAGVVLAIITKRANTAALIGANLAVSLLPPLVACGLYLSGDDTAAAHNTQKAKRCAALSVVNAVLVYISFSVTLHSFS